MRGTGRNISFPYLPPPANVKNTVTNQTEKTQKQQGELKGRSCFQSQTPGAAAAADCAEIPGPAK